MEDIRLEHLSITYDGRKEVVKDISLAIEQGEILTIVGESGSGKSTLLHAICDLLPRTATLKGLRRVLGKDLGLLSAKDRKDMRGKDLAVIFQDTGRYMNPIAKVGRQFDEFLRVHTRQTKEERRDTMLKTLEKVHLTAGERILASYPFELSGGMRQRVGIAMAIALRPKILLADEPTSALDVTVQAQVVEEMKALRDEYGMTIVMVTHNIGLAAYMSDRIGVMCKGELVELGDRDVVIYRAKHAYTKSLVEAVSCLEDSRLIGDGA